MATTFWVETNLHRRSIHRGWAVVWMKHCSRTNTLYMARSHGYETKLTLGGLASAMLLARRLLAVALPDRNELKFLLARAGGITRHRLGKDCEQKSVCRLLLPYFPPKKKCKLWGHLVVRGGEAWQCFQADPNHGWESIQILGKGAVSIFCCNLGCHVEVYFKITSNTVQNYKLK